MASLSVTRRHRLPVAQAKRIAQKVADQLASEVDLVSEWKGDVLHFSRSGVDGTVTVTGSEIRLDAKLGLLIGAFSRTIEQQIEQRLDALLATSAPAKTKAVRRKRRPKEAQ